MNYAKSLKALSLYTLVAAICGAGQAAYAHTGIKDSVDEGKSIYTAFTITHGCQDTPGKEKLLPVAAQSVVFPNSVNPAGAEAFKINADGSETAIDLTTELEGTVGDSLATLSPGMVQDKNVFKKQKEIVEIDTKGTPEATDDVERVRAIQLTNGNLDTTAVGLIPFRVTAPKFKAASCAKSLKIRIAIANYCNKTKNTDKDNRSDIWIGDVTPLFNDGGVMPHDWETSPFWPTLTVKRTTANNCAAEQQYDIAVQPAESDIDNFLGIKGYWPK